MKNPFPIERMMRDLCSSTDGVVYTILIFDAGRDIVQEKARGLGNESDPDLE